MPRAEYLAWQNRGEIDAVETACVGAIVRRGATNERLRQKKQRDDGKVFDRGALARRNNSGKQLGMHMSALPASRGN